MVPVAAWSWERNFFAVSYTLVTIHLHVPKTNPDISCRTHCYSCHSSLYIPLSPRYSHCFVHNISYLLRPCPGASSFCIAILFLIFFFQWYQTPIDNFVDCTSTFWLKDNGCGLDGQLCKPFNTTNPLEFRCPARCTSVILANQRAVGAQEITYVPLVVGGGDAEQTYRGDSWICVAAIQSYVPLS
jgi:hypothetical protein